MAEPRKLFKDGIKCMAEGRIIKSVAGTYTVLTDKETVICQPRGRLRLEGISPVTGDLVVFSIENDGSGVIEEILPRRNVLERPTIANIDQVVVIFALEPLPNFLLVDKILIAAEHLDLRCVIVVNKIELSDRSHEHLDYYKNTGYSLHQISVRNSCGLNSLAEKCNGHISVLAGQSGVGKSSIINSLCPEANLSTQEISHKRGFGRHTTRTVSLLTLPNGGLLADTPGFNKFDMGTIPSIKLAAHFPEMVPFLGKCRFKTCMHQNEPDCAVLAAVDSGFIHSQRYANYLAILSELRENEKRKYQ